MVFEVSGSQAGAETMTKLPRTRGRIVVVAILRRAAQGGSVPLLLARTEALRRARVRAGRFRSWPSNWRLPARCRSTALITDVLPLDGLEEAMHRMEGGGAVHEDSGELHGLIL